MIEPFWLSVDEIVAIHAGQLARFVGPSGVRDQGALVSAVMRPVNRFHYGESDRAVLAAAYAFGLHAITPSWTATSALHSSR